MKYEQLGRTDLKVSTICMGCWQLTERMWGKVPIEPWERAIHGALDLGVNFIDTADAYGNGYAEERLGDVLQRNGTRDEFVIATKFYWNFQAEPYHPDTTYDHIMSACEQSLRRLRIDCIDLYQVHSYDHLTVPQQVARALLTLKEQGKVRWFGVSNFNPEQMQLFARHFRIDSLQPPYSLLNREAEQREFPYCLMEEIGVIVYSPLYRGLLTGKYPRDHQFADSRAGDPLFSGAALSALLGGLDKLRPYAEKHGLTLAQLAIRWVLTPPPVTCAIVGIKTDEQLATIVPAAEEVLPMDDWFHIGLIMTEAKKAAQEAGAA